ncbi:Glucans biosynthesis protein G precursor [Marinomonas aquimarina]|uniref:Glucans biosynthesis protein G n=1 Tax=Marinomonas aquimarina TaxID=295068 RepID=A0A1A8T426_9GAMM|nr:glucan biosynthesis protein G [Marinomonas aquimarina]SBS26946.1 Glucans biosynthesis protein G precursor [Marinomonas aquimarina]
MLKFTTFTLPLLTALSLPLQVNAQDTTQEPTNTTVVADASSTNAGYSFSRQTVIDLAQKLSQSPMQAPARAPDALNNLDYDTYRKINFQQNQAVWGQTPTQFSIQLFAPGFLYKDLVEIDAVENARAYPIEANKDSFVTPTEEIDQLISDLGKFAGLRLHYPINKADYKDEFIVFQGASYFRAVSKGQTYGVSARGLAIDVAQPTGEEFPMFRHFWIERPSSSQQAIVVHALLDSKSVTGAYRFGIFPGSPTRIDVEATLFPRRDIAHIGLAPLTSMYMFNGSLDYPEIEDYRVAVHDSEGLQIQTGRGEMLWRPLQNPETLQISAFMDQSPQGFGLIQRNRDFSDYQDLEANYHSRPSIWVKPLNDWGEGHVELVEIPSNSEANDNIVAYWQPTEPLKKDQPFNYSYRLTMTNDTPVLSGKAHVVRSAKGQKLASEHAQVVIDFDSIEVENLASIQVDASISQGQILEAHVTPNPYEKGVRAFVTFDPGNADSAELRVQLKQDETPLAATWLYRWLGE